jgi:CheY-like chemotaxis protein
MGLEIKLTDFVIERILVVDDTSENLDAAREYFSQLEVEVDYASSEKEAKEMIEASILDRKKYNLVISDLEMECKDSGKKVLELAYTNQIMGYIATGLNYGALDDAIHGPQTTILPLKEKIPGRKSSSFVWQLALDKILSDLGQGSKEILKSLARYEKFVGKPSPETGKMALKTFD